MAVDLATSGSLGYGIGLQAKVPDRTGLILQLENQRLRRKALENQAQEEEAKKAEKQDYLFQKALNIDQTKWHRTLVPTVNKLASDVYKKYTDLYARDPKAARNSIGMFVKEFNEGINGLETTNDQRKQLQKYLTDKVLKGMTLTGDEQPALNYLTTKADIELDEPFIAPFGEFTVNPNSTISYQPIAAGNAKDDAEKASLDNRYFEPTYQKEGLGKIGIYPAYTDQKVADYMKDRYTNNPSKKMSDMADVSETLKAAWINSGRQAQGESFSDFLKKHEGDTKNIIDPILLNYNKSFFVGKKIGTESYDANLEVSTLAGRLALKIASTSGTKKIIETGNVPQEDIDNAWNGFKSTEKGKFMIDDLGGETKAKNTFKAYVKNEIQKIRPIYESGGFGAGKDFKLSEITVGTGGTEEFIQGNKLAEVRKKKIKFDDELNKAKAKGERTGESPTTELTQARSITGATIKTADTDKIFGFEGEIPPKLKKVQWATGGDGEYSTATGTFGGILYDKDDNPKGIIIEEVASGSITSLGDKLIVPFDKATNKKRISDYGFPGVEKVSPAKAETKKTETKKTETKKPKFN